jgi:hypothetical protein
MATKDLSSKEAEFLAAAKRELAGKGVATSEKPASAMAVTTATAAKPIAATAAKPSTTNLPSPSARNLPSPVNPAAPSAAKFPGGLPQPLTGPGAMAPAQTPEATRSDPPPAAPGMDAASRMAWLMAAEKEAIEDRKRRVKRVYTAIICAVLIPAFLYAAVMLIKVLR